MENIIQHFANSPPDMRQGLRQIIRESISIACGFIKDLLQVSQNIGREGPKVSSLILKDFQEYVSFVQDENNTVRQNYKLMIEDMGPMLEKLPKEYTAPKQRLSEYVRSVSQSETRGEELEKDLEDIKKILQSMQSSQNAGTNNQPSVSKPQLTPVLENPFDVFGPPQLKPVENTGKSSPAKITTKYFMIDKDGKRVEIDNPESPSKQKIMQSPDPRFNNSDTMSGAKFNPSPEQVFYLKIVPRHLG